MDNPTFPKQLGRKVVYESEWINLYLDRVLLPSGNIIEEYHILDYPSESVVVLLQNGDGELCFIKALRYTTQQVEWEIPAGGIDKGESILQAATREVKEETGLSTQHLQLQYSYNPSNGMSNQVVHIVFGEVNNPMEAGVFGTDEVKSVHWLGVEEVQELIQQQAIADGVSLMAVLLYLSRTNSG